MLPSSKKLKKTVTIFILVVILAANFSFIKPADALFGIADQSFNFTMGDIPRLLGNIAEKIGKQLLEQMRRQMIRTLTNDIVNWVQNGGKPRFVQNFGAEVKKAGDRAAGQVLQDLFLAKGINICSPFKASVNVMVQKVIFPPEDGDGEGFQCTLGDIKQNLESSLQSFADDFTGKEGGDWKTWFQLHETQNTLAGSYLAARKLTVTKVNKEAQTAEAEITLGAGFLDQKLCAKAEKIGVVMGDVQAPDIKEIFTVDLQRIPIKAGTPTNSNVKRLQKFLNQEEPKGLNVNANIKEDGLFGPETESAVKLFQRIWGLEADGIVGKETRDALNQAAYLASPAANDLTAAQQAVSYETQTKSYENLKGGGIAMDKLPTDEKCIETIVATPGSIIGDQLSGVLKSTGIDNIIHADELAQILDGVINAAVNRVAQKGLSLMNSGKGSWSSPARGTYKDRLSQRSADIPGMEGAKAVEILNQVIEFRNNAQNLKNTLDQLTIRSDENNKNKFADRLNEIFGDESETPEFKHYKFDFYTTNGSTVGRRCKGGVNRAIDNCMFAKTEKDSYDLRQEKFHPGPYIANQILYSKLAEKWSKVQRALASLNSLTETSCRVPDVKVVLDPNPDALPFTDSESKEFKLTDGDLKNYLQELATASTTNSALWKQETLPLLDGLAGATQAQYQQLADSYTGLIEGLAAKKESAETDMKYADTHSPIIIFYASLLMDYDRSGRSFNLISATQKYQTALNANDEAIIDQAKKNLLNAQKQTRDDWLRVQEIFNASAMGAEITGDKTIADKTIVTQKMKDDALRKIDAINKTNKLIQDSLSAMEEASEEASNDPTYLGLTSSQALAQAMDLNIEQLINELDQRAARVSQAQNETGNMLGKFETNQDERFRLGLEGGDSEWEKYFKNRFQYAFVSWIYDYFGRNFNCTDKIGQRLQAAVEATRPQQIVEYYDNFLGFRPSEIRIKINTAVTFQFKQSDRNSKLIFNPTQEFSTYKQAYFNGPQAMLEKNGQTYTYIFDQKGSWVFHNFGNESHQIKITVE